MSIITHEIHEKSKLASNCEVNVNMNVFNTVSI